VLKKNKRTRSKVDAEVGERSAQADEQERLSRRSLSLEVKASDSRAKRHLAEHGDRAWEDDILPADVIEAMLEASLDEWLDPVLWDRRDAEIEAARKRAPAPSAEALASVAKGGSLGFSSQCPRVRRSRSRCGRLYWSCY
jgi:hypothetical protein